MVVSDAHVTIKVDTTAFLAAMTEAGAALARAGSRVAASFARAERRRAEDRARRIHQPIPLAIDGHSYARRRKSRTRRSRR